MPVSIESISLKSRSACSTRLTRSSAYSRLDPTGIVSRTLVKLSSLSGIISVPTTPAIGIASAKLSAAIHNVIPRGVIVAKRGFR